MSLINYINIPNKLWCNIYQTGSSVICNPPVLDTDIDFIIYSDELEELGEFITKEGYSASCTDKEEYQLESEGFKCYRKDNINLIVTNDNDFYVRWVLATKTAKMLNLLRKQDRITLFQAILYGVAPPPIDDIPICLV